MTVTEHATGLRGDLVLGDDVLTLRCLRDADAQAMVDGDDPDQVRWLNDGHTSDLARTQEWIGRNQREWRDGGPRRNLGIVDRATGALAGTVEAHLALPDLPPGTVNVAYGVFPAFRGRGYAARAVGLLCTWLGAATDAATVVLRIDADNAPSLGVACDPGLRRAGLVRVGPGPDGLVHHALPLRRAARVALACGPAGSGKSTLAGRLERAGFVRLSFDEEAWRRGHRDHPLPAHVAAAVHDVLRARLVAHVRAGRDVVVDTSFWSRASRDSYRALVAPVGVVPVTYHLATPREEVLRRLAARTGAGPDDVVVPAELARAHVDGFEVPTPDEGPLVVLGRG
ncbi:GNAT family N-acetyltransferase [Cellulomonas sp. NS3]|uniref:GNAT family N-acetyltransferase n=1 Tax=Cellulomonas sp. NS3 TaxID=2973977 RepID=UPI00216355DE|nr:GNAT family N-acetyltransferase [Cellulomonas sp. NS3]